MFLYGVREVNTLLSQAKIGCSLRLSWHDSRLTWDPDKFFGMKKTRLATDPATGRNYIWTPDIESYENGKKMLYSSLRRGLA